jgi:biopolymer transport protein ExbD
MPLTTRNKVNASFSMSSMTDIVFLLLIFFMLTSTLVTTNALDLVLPNSNSKVVDKQTLSVSIDKNLVHYIDRDEVEASFMESTLLSRLSDAEEKVVVLRVEQGVPIEYAVSIMDIAYRNKLKVVLATQPE